jgi:hypothetical protein
MSNDLRRSRLELEGRIRKNKKIKKEMEDQRKQNKYLLEVIEDLKSKMKDGSQWTYKFAKNFE